MVLRGLDFHSHDIDVGQTHPGGMGYDLGRSEGRCESGSHGQERRVLDTSPQGCHFVGFDVVATVIDGIVRSQDADIAIATAAQVVEYPRSNGTLDEIDGFGFGHVFLPTALENGHGGQATASHGGVIEFCRRSVGVDLVDSGSVEVTATEDERRGNVSLVAEQASLQERTGGGNTGGTVGVHAQEFELRRDHLSHHFRVGSGPRTAAIHVGGEVMNLFAILFGNFRAGSGTGIGPQDHTVLVHDADDGSSCLFGLREMARTLHSQDCLVPQGVLEGKARNGGL